MARDFNWTLGLDIGSFHINAVIADIGQANEIIVKGIGNSMTTGISRGQIVSPTDLAQSIDRAIKRAEREAGFRPTDVVVSVLPYQITFGYSSGLVIPRRSGGRITEEDKINCVQKSKNAIKSLDQLLIHAIPLEFTLDGKTVAEPTGKTGNSLEVNTHFVLGNAANIQAILQSTQALRLRVAGMIYTPIATAQMALSDIERQEGALLIEIGARFTTVSLFRRGILQSAMAIPVGGETITNDICQCLAVTPPEAERIKVLYGSADPTQVDPRERLEITSPEKGRHEIKRAYLCKI
ncbi:cell division protein FtsA, partial [bacterium]|nr:cell division protein FtsA [bacterium]